MFSENSELQKDEFKKIINKHFPETQFHPTKDGIGLWTDIVYTDRVIKLTWERGLPRLERDYAKPNAYKSHPEFDAINSNVYISVVNKDAPDEEKAWGAASMLQPGSLTFVKKVKVMVQELGSAGMTIEFLPNDPKKSSFFKKSMKNMGMNRITGSNYWTKQMPPGLAPSQPPETIR